MNIFLGEFIGMSLLILLGNGAIANVLLSKAKGANGGWIVITAGWGFAAAVAVYTVGWISGAHLNPAVTIGFCIAGKTASSLISTYLLGQMAGAMVGSFLVWIAYFSHWASSEPRLKRLCFCTEPAIRNPLSNFITEVIATGVLVIGILGISNVHNGMSPVFGPYAIGILIFAIGLSLGGPTGFAINPARDLGPRLMHAWLPIAGKGPTDWGYAWIPVAGPLLGGTLGALLYQHVLAHLTPL